MAGIHLRLMELDHDGVGLRRCPCPAHARTGSGCRVDQTDISRWETTDRGARKLCAVLVHDKYDMSLRVEAALALIRMKPRSGRRPAFSQIDPDGDLDACKRTFVEALGSGASDNRQAMGAGRVPPCILELMNGPFANEIARTFAARLDAEAKTPDAQVTLAYRLTAGRAPSLQEKKLALDFLKANPLSEFALAILNLNAFLYVD